jgi:hypothetical protein
MADQNISAPVDSLKIAGHLHDDQIQRRITGIVERDCQRGSFRTNDLWRKRQRHRADGVGSGGDAEPGKCCRLRSHSIADTKDAAPLTRSGRCERKCHRASIIWRQTGRARICNNHEVTRDPGSLQTDGNATSIRYGDVLGGSGRHPDRAGTERNRRWKQNDGTAGDSVPTDRDRRLTASYVRI